MTKTAAEDNCRQGTAAGAELRPGTRRLSNATSKRSRKIQIICPPMLNYVMYSSGNIKMRGVVIVECRLMRRNVRPI